MFGQSLLSAFGIACTTDTDQLFGTNQSVTSIATYQLNASPVTSIPGNNYPGTSSNITYAAGKFGNAAVFNGSNSKIIANGKPLNNNTSITISFWARNISSSDWKTLLGEGGDSGNTPGYKIYTSPPSVANSNYLWMARADNSGYVFDTYDGSAANKGGVNMGVAGSTWVHCVFTVSPTQLIVYKNGVNVKSLSISNTSSVAGYYDFQFMYDTKYNRYLQGELDQVRLFDTTLSQAAVTALYNETTTTATSASVDYVAANPNSIAYYKMSDATDQLGNYNGTATNVNFNTEGKFGFAGAFNGSNADIDLPSNIDSTTMSISFWIYIDSIVTGNEVVIELENGYGVWFLASAGGKLGMQSSNANSAHTLSNSQLSAGSWHHVAAVWNSGSRTFYIDNTVQSGGSVADYLTCNENTIGSRRSGEFFDGKIDQIRVYDAVLSAADVSTLYKEVECEPAAINALANFNTVLYTGNNSTQSITGVGFQPDFVWFKNRTGTNNNALVDSVRGRGSYLFSDDNYAASTGGSASNDVTSFDSNGFSLGSVSQAGSTNTSGGSIVAWNWKAPLANLSTNFYTSNSGIEVSQTLLGSGSTKIFSISFWFKTSSNNEQYFINTAAASTNTGIGIFVNPTNGYLRYQTSNGGGSASSGPYLSLEDRNLQDGKWHHVVATYSSAGGTNDAYTYLYVDGQNVTSLCTGKNSWTQGGAATWSSFTVPKIVFGKWADGNFYNIVGNLAQVRFFSDVVTLGEVSDLYTEPATSNNTLNYPAGAGCIAAYPLQTDAVDLSGNYSGASSNVTFGQPGYLTSNTDGAIPSTVAANVEAGFSVVQWTSPSGNGNPSNVGHGLNSAPELIFYKGINYADNWYVYSQPTGLNKYLNLNTNGSVTTNNSNGFTNVNSSTFTTNLVNGSYNILSYCFTSIPGYSKIGSYVGTGSSGNFQYTGFQPSWLMVKCSNVSGRQWTMFDNKRISGSSYYELYANLNSAENGPYPDITLSSTGFTLEANASGSNQSGDTYIYLAIA